MKRSFSFFWSFRNFWRWLLILSLVISSGWYLILSKITEGEEWAAPRSKIADTKSRCLASSHGFSSTVVGGSWPDCRERFLYFLLVCLGLPSSETQLSWHLFPACAILVMCSTEREDSVRIVTSSFEDCSLGMEFAPNIKNQPSWWSTSIVFLVFQ